MTGVGLPCLFVSDLHGRRERYRKLWQVIVREHPQGVFLGGDLLPHAMDFSWRTSAEERDFVGDFLVPGFRRLQTELGNRYPRVFLILGNDDPRAEENGFEAQEKSGLWEYMHARRTRFHEFSVYGYSCVPPSPFQLKDWERYDVSRFVDPGCVSPEEGYRTAGPVGRQIRLTTIAKELADLAGGEDLAQAIFLTHCPPYGCHLDRAALDGQMVDHVSLDVHVGSIALQRFISERQPLLTLHGHVHESRSLTNEWHQFFGRTLSCNAAAEGTDLALIRFDPRRLQDISLEVAQLPESGNS